jgi:RNA polymerase sigma-70 factor, ECF subfamily
MRSSATSLADGRAGGEDGAIGEDDEVLVERARRGDRDAYGELVRRHERVALRVATIVLGTHEGAHDVAQDAVLRAYRGLPGFRGGSPFGPWFLRIVANCARNDRRSRGRRANLALRAAGQRVVSGPSAEETAIVHDDMARVVAAMNQLPEIDRLVLALRHVEGMTEAAMAEVLECAPGTVKSRISRALDRLRAVLEADGHEGADRDA